MSTRKKEIKRVCIIIVILAITFVLASYFTDKYSGEIENIIGIFLQNN